MFLIETVYSRMASMNINVNQINKHGQDIYTAWRLSCNISLLTDTIVLWLLRNKLFIKFVSIYRTLYTFSIHVLGFILYWLVSITGWTSSNVYIIIYCQLVLQLSMSGLNGTNGTWNEEPSSSLKNRRKVKVWNQGIFIITCNHSK